jgi:hypothetical protein
MLLLLVVIFSVFVFDIGGNAYRDRLEPLDVV